MATMAKRDADDSDDFDGDGAPAPGVLTALLTLVARRQRAALASALIEHGLYPGQEQVLILLNDMIPRSTGEIAAALQVRAPTISKMIIRLEAQGLLKRADNEMDGRLVAVTLTEKGLDLLEVSAAALLDVEQRMVSDISVKRQRRLEKLLIRMARGLDSPDPELVE
jgi:MarR family transcriptional regulator, organic hydroperoxide resistance regulator